MVTHHQHQRFTDVFGNDGEQRRGDDAPNHKCVPLPLPDGLEQAHWVVAEVMLAVLGWDARTHILEMVLA